MNEPLLRIVISQTWQIVALTIVVALIVRIVARNRPHLAHALWILVLIKCVTPPLWGHSLGVFSQIQALAAPGEVAAGIEDANLRVDTIEVDELANPEASPEMAEVADSEAMISANDELLEPQLDAEPQRSEVAEEAWDDETQTDLASLRLGDSAFEIPPFEPEAEIHAAEQPSLLAISRLPSLLFGGFLIGAIVTLMIMVIRCLRCLRQIRLHRTTEFDDVLRVRIQQLAKLLGIRRIPNIIVSDVLFGPAVLGLLRHTIVLPRCLFEDVGDGWRAERRKSPDDVTLPVMQRQQSEDLRPAARQNVLESAPADFNLQFLNPILAHELLHIRRGDLRTGTLQAIVQSLWWFHPAVWFCNRWLSREAERCCDEQVIAELGCTPAHYARSLLSVIECKHRLQPIPVFPGMKPVEITSQRLERIMSLKNGLKKRTPIWCWLMIVALAFVVLPGAVATPTFDEVAPNEANDNTEILQKDEVGAQLPQFEGNVFWNDADLREYLGGREQANDVDTATTLASDCESIKSKYRDVGFFDVEVVATTSPADNPTNRSVQFQIKEGPQYKIREIRYEGNARISASDLQQGSILKSGEMYDSSRTSKDMHRIRERYKDLCFKCPAIHPVPQFSEESGVVDLVFEIDENPVAYYSRKTHDVGDLLTRLEMDQGVPAADAHRQLHRVLEASIWGLYDYFSQQPADAPYREMYIHLNGDQLEVSTSDAVHAQIPEELGRFRKLGFKRFQVTARFIAGSAEEIDALMSSLKMETSFSNAANAPVEATPNNTDGVKAEQSGEKTIRMGAAEIVSRDKGRAIEKAARSKADCLTVECVQLQSYNGQAAMTHVGEAKPYIVEFNENDEPTIRTVVDGMTLHVTPTIVDDGLIRLQCVSGMEAVSKTQTVTVLRSSDKLPNRIEVPVIKSKQVQTTVDLQADQTLLLSGLTTNHDGKSQVILFIMDAVPISMKPLTSLIRLDDSFIPSPEMELTGDTILAYVADKKITVADVANGLLERLKKDPTVTPEQRQKTLLDTVVQHLPGYLYDELVLHEFRRTLTPDKEAEIRKSLEPAFSELLQTMSKDMEAKDPSDLERMLQEQGFSIEVMRASYIRRQFVVGYSQSMPVGSPIQNQGAIEAYCRQLLLEYADDEMSMERFLALPDPPSFAVFGIVKNTGWQKLEKEIRLLDAIEMAGGVEDSEGVSIAITNSDIVEGKAIPVSMSLQVLRNDTSGKLNRVVKDGDMINVTRNDSTEAAQAGSTDGVKVQGNGVNSDSRLVGTFKNDDQREVPAVAAPPEIAENKPASKENSPEARFVLCTYPVADLVMFRQPVIATIGQSAVADDPAPQPLDTAASPAVAPENSADQVEANPLPTLREPKAIPLNFKADFAPLTALIKATVQPESWDTVGPTIIGVDEKTLSLVIRHTQAAHFEICKLIVQLRKADDHMISISSQIVMLTDDAQVQWLGAKCSLHSQENGTQWVLLSKQRSEVFTRELLGQKPDVLSAPKVMTISGQTATIQVGQTNTEDDTTIGVRMELTPHLLPDTKDFRLQHAVQIGKLSAEVLLPVESLVGSGQTLLLLLDAASENKEPEVSTSKYLLLITPEYVPIVEEKETVATPNSLPTPN